MEPPTFLPRRATTLTRLWQRTDAADSIAQFLPTEALPVLPNLAKTFERDHWRLLGALMRRAKRGTAAACKSAVLSTLQMGGRDSYHFRADWADQARFDENWTVFGYRGYHDDGGGGEPEPVDYTARVSQGTLVLDRTTPKNSTNLASRFDIPGAGDRCCVHRFRVALAYNPYDGMTIGSGGHVQFVNMNYPWFDNDLFCLYVAYRDGATSLRWYCKNMGAYSTLKTAPTQHTFLVDATLDWRTATARLTVDGAVFERPMPFQPLPVTTMYLECGEEPGQSTFGPVDVWYSNTPPPQPPSSVRFKGEQ